MPQNPNCTLCPLHEHASHVCIWGERRGPQPVGDHPRIMLLGQGPGAEENLAGRPFVGASGHMLNEGTTLAGITDYYVTNLTKCDPWPLKEPPKEAIAACAPYLEEEIAAIRPTHILAIGAPAMRYLLGPKKITEVAGKEFWSEKYQATVVPIVHPAHILRSGKGKDPWMAEMGRFGALTRGAIPATPPVAIYPLLHEENLRDFVAYMKRSRRGFTFDFETKPKDETDPKLGLHWWHKNFVAYSIAFSFDEHSSWVLPLWHPQSPFLKKDYVLSWFFREMREVMQDPQVPKTPHNMLFDDLVWWRVAGYQPYTTCDTAVLVHTLHEDEPVRLKWQVPTKFGWPNWDINAGEEHDLGDLLPYMGYDSAGTVLLKKHLLAELAQDQTLQKYFGQFVMPYMRALERLIWNGVPLNEELTHQRIAECAHMIEAADAKIPVENPASADQIRSWFYEELGLPVYKLTDGGKPSTDEESINWLALQGYTDAKNVLDARRPRKNESTYFRPALWEVGWSHDHRRHFEYNGSRVETGRLSSSYHVIPRDPFVRSVYSSPPGKVWVHLDARQIEARLVAWYAAGEPAVWDNLSPQFATLLFAFKEGRDPYRETAAAALRKTVPEVTADERQRMGKVPTLAMLYDISWMGFKEYAWKDFEIVYTDAEAQHLHTTFYRLWPEIKMWHNHVKKMVSYKGFVRSPIGRLRHVPEAMSSNRKIAGDAQREAINAGPQGLASDILQQALILADAWLPVEDIQIIGDCHDALDFLVRDEPDVLAPFLEHVEELLPAAVEHLKSFGLFLPPGLIQAEVLVGGLAGTTEAHDYLKTIRAAVDAAVATA